VSVLGEVDGRHVEYELTSKRRWYLRSVLGILEYIVVLNWIYLSVQEGA
jgi:hypothetical protein